MLSVGVVGVGYISYVGNQALYYHHKYCDMAEELLRHGDYDGAIENYRAYLRHYPGEASVRYELGLAMMKKGDLVEARHEFLRTMYYNSKSDLLNANCRAQIEAIDKSQ
jgi:Flp pilus assembly protein TadD